MIRLSPQFQFRTCRSAQHRPTPGSSSWRRSLVPRLVCAAVLLATPATAHETQDPGHAAAHVIPAAIERNRVEITVEGDTRVIRSNGIPRHATGQFPSRGNPHAISAQNHVYRVPVTPRWTGRATPKEGPMGVAVNGVPFEPGTAECYGRGRGQPGPMATCAWHEEAIVDGRGQLGLDRNNAHVQPTGAYHYHGLPNGLLAFLPGDTDLVPIGYAADGFRLMVSRSNAYRPGYGLKEGRRPSGPGGRYDGTYTADYEFTGSGTLDRCNGAEIAGEYVYFITEDFPFAPRCLMGVADASFDLRRPDDRGGMQGRSQGGRQDGRPPPRFQHDRRQPPLWRN